ncbi:MAG: hypothetical protein J3R72DRAFT_64773 [Linnemannia gamsii]|nr:MAG: hypothetical protein J3R72DRAFT_64773 [Linnemannia gamsii]
MVPTPTQFHHYIPRFILKSFADNFLLKRSNSEFIADTSGIFKPTSPSGVQLGGSSRGRGSSGRGNKGGAVGGAVRGGHQGGTGQAPFRHLSYYINVYRVKDHTTELSDIKRAYGVTDMYRDITADDEMKFEKLLGNLESTSATFIRKIWSGEDLSLTRSQLADMKKFLCIMMYRGENRRGQYYNIQFDLDTLTSVKRHMVHNNIKKVQDVWFDNLKWLVETPVSGIIEEFKKALNIAPKNPFAIALQYKGPIHVLELLDFGQMANNYVCIWEAEEGSEFILSEGCFGAYEGHMDVTFHNFFIVSPRYAIVLVNRLYMWNMMEKLPYRKSWFGEELHANPDTVYVNGPLPTDCVESDFSPNDVFKYRRIVVPKKDVFMVNGIFLDARTKYLTYKSPVNMLKSLRFYDKAKKDNMFKTQHDYSILKRKLFADLNRTHSS